MGFPRCGGVLAGRRGCQSTGATGRLVHSVYKRGRLVEWQYREQVPAHGGTLRNFVNHLARCWQVLSDHPGLSSHGLQTQLYRLQRAETLPPDPLLGTDFPHNPSSFTCCPSAKGLKSEMHTQTRETGRPCTEVLEAPIPFIR